MTNKASESEQTTEDQKKKGLNPLLIMLIVFGLPYALAWYFLYGGNPTDFEAPSNSGEIISPMIALPAYSLELMDGKLITSESLSNNWSVFTVSKKCGEACKRTLLVIRQARKAMAVDRDVIKPILLLEDDQALKGLDIDLAKDFNTLHIATSQSSKDSGLLNIFSSSVPELENSIFMVDPFGNFMMAYPADTEQLGLLDDMKRLLKVNPVHR
tara:strand:- start:11358 stop:11996 length:639 start_codon:yes stop_codon:yes gene_type:complete